MSADISAARGSSAAETSEALSAADGLDLSIDGSYVTCGVSDSTSPVNLRLAYSARTRFITASGSASAGTAASTRSARAGGSAPSQKSVSATTPQRPAGWLGAAEPSQRATSGTGPCGQAGAASVWMNTGHS